VLRGGEYTQVGENGMTMRLLEVAPGWQRPDGCGTAVTIGAARIALFAIGHTVAAVEDACARCGASLSGCALTGAVATCPGCGWRYDVATGAATAIPAIRLQTFPVRVDGARLLIEWTEPSA